MCHPGDNEFMPVDKTWGIMPLLVMSTWDLFYVITLLTSDCPFSYVGRDRPPVSFEQFIFLERIFNKTNLEKRMWAK